MERGLIIDPDLDGSYNINTGLRIARKILVQLTDMGLPTAFRNAGSHHSPVYFKT